MTYRRHVALGEDRAVTGPNPVGQKELRAAFSSSQGRSVVAIASGPDAREMARRGRTISSGPGPSSGDEQAKTKLGCIESDEVAIAFGPPA
jgi:hypothetical protein